MSVVAAYAVHKLFVGLIGRAACARA